MAEIKNPGLRLSNVARPVYPKDNYPIAVANELQGGFHIVRKKEEAEKDVQRLMIGMEIFCLEDGKKYRLVDATITCNKNRINCPFNNNKNCLYNNPKCRVSKITNLQWRVIDEGDASQIIRWQDILYPTIPVPIRLISEEKYLSNFYTRNISLFHNVFEAPINLLADDGKIDKRLLRDNEPIGNNVDSGSVEFYNPNIIIDHSFYPRGKWYGREGGVPYELDTIETLHIDDLVQQVNVSLLTNLKYITHGSTSRLNYLRIANSSITELDFRYAPFKKTLETLIVNDNPFLEKIIINDVDSLDPKHRIPLKVFSCRNCPNLKEICINGSQITSLDLSTLRSLKSFSAKNSQLISLLVQTDFGEDLEDSSLIAGRGIRLLGGNRNLLGEGTSRNEYGEIINEGLIHYYIGNCGMNEKSFEMMFHSAYNAKEDYIIVFHIGDDKYARNCDYTIATEKGHMVIYN